MKAREGAPSGLFAEKCIECGRSPATRWWIGRVDLDPEGVLGRPSVSEVVAPDCGSCSEAIRDVYLRRRSGYPEVRELPYEELCLMRVMFS